MSVLSIIGTAGRGQDATKLTLPLWNDMKRCVYRFVKSGGYRHIVSGGAAGADHLAVGLYNAGLVETLTLALPCAYDWDNSRFADTGEFNFRTNPGGTSNHYHRQFSAVIGRNTLEELKVAIHKGAKVEIECGFMARNSIVARADVMIAFTFGEGAMVKNGGTADTCRKYLAQGKTQLFHVDLNTMILHENATVS